MISLPAELGTKAKHGLLVTVYAVYVLQSTCSFQKKKKYSPAHANGQMTSGVGIWRHWPVLAAYQRLKLFPEFFSLRSAGAGKHVGLSLVGRYCLVLVQLVDGSCSESLVPGPRDPVIC